MVSGLNVKVFPYLLRIHSHNGPSRLSCFSVRRVQTRPLFSTSSDASMLFFFFSFSPPPFSSFPPPRTRAGEQPCLCSETALLGHAKPLRGEIASCVWTSSLLLDCSSDTVGVIQRAKQFFLAELKSRQTNCSV